MKNIPKLKVLEPWRADKGGNAFSYESKLIVQTLNLVDVNENRGKSKKEKKLGFLKFVFLCEAERETNRETNR